MSIKPIISIICGAALLASCSTSKSQLPYFSDLTADEGVLELQEYSTTIKPDDELFISITSPSSPEFTDAFNLPLTNPGSKQNLANKVTTTPLQQTYVVDSKGDITMPVIGKLHVAGMKIGRAHV